MEDSAKRLVVDDEQAITELLEGHLTQRGYDVTAAARTEDAIRRLSRNGTDLVTSGTVGSGTNLVGTAPPFADRVGRDYRLPGTAAAVDNGTNSPPGGLGDEDPDGNPRILNGTVDIGAYEWGGIFEDGFESGDTTRWSISVP